MTPADYRAKAEELLERTQAAEPKGNPHLVSLALSYLRLADLAEKNATNDMFYEMPALRVPMQQQPQAQQQPQQAAKPEPSDEKQ
jgi:hypothetical protein